MKNRIYRIVLAAAVWLAGIIGNSIIKIMPGWMSFLLYLTSYVIIGRDIFLKAVRNIKNGNVFDENFLMSIAAIGAFIIGEYAEGAAVMLFYQTGEFFQDYAVDKSRKSIADLMDIRPEFANVKAGSELIEKDPEDVMPGDIILIKAGERVPLDGRVLEGSSLLDTSSLTGESVPREVQPGSEILSGCINLTGTLTVEVTREYGESTVSRILDLVENATDKKSGSERFITRFARYYTPVVVIIAVFLALIPPLVIKGAAFSDWFYRSLSFLVVACPCALVISVPLSFFGGIGGASSRGVLVKGGNYLEALAQVDGIVFDKTGTLTKGVFKIQDIQPTQHQGRTKEEILELSAYAEHFSNHPISLSLKEEYGREIDASRISEMEELPGHGVRAVVDGKVILAGNDKLMAENNIYYPPADAARTLVYVAVDGEYAGFIRIDDEIKEDSYKAIKDLKKVGIRKAVMLTGDRKSAAEKVSRELGLDQVFAELLPDGKLEKLEELLKESPPKSRLAFAGDGINDAPALTRADVGIAMGGLGSDAAIEAADIVLMTDEPSKIATAVRIAKKTLRIAWQNIYLAISIKVLVLLLSAFGITSLWAAIFADVGVTIIAVLNSLRALYVKNL
ncbi:MAG: cadmium-translocating P-type ATPase [Clostridiales bacterium]|nr:cadmium-translocating P-type ATPase [Clostridiales bacterium]